MDGTKKVEKKIMKEGQGKRGTEEERYSGRVELPEPDAAILGSSKEKGLISNK